MITTKVVVFFPVCVFPPGTSEFRHWRPCLAISRTLSSFDLHLWHLCHSALWRANAPPQAHKVRGLPTLPTLPTLLVPTIDHAQGGALPLDGQGTSRGSQLRFVLFGCEPLGLRLPARLDCFGMDGRGAVQAATHAHLIRFRVRDRARAWLRLRLRLRLWLRLRVGFGLGF